MTSQQEKLVEHNMNSILNTKDLYLKFRESYAKKMSINSMLVPKLEHVTISVGCGKIHKDSGMISYIYNEIRKIAAQKPVKAKAKKSISNFALREGSVVGIYVTVRNQNMFDFLDRLILIAMPRRNDFYGFKRGSFDKNNNYNFGIKRQDIFVEADSYHLFGMNISIGIKSSHRSHAEELLQYIRMPFIGGVKSESK